MTGKTRGYLYLTLAQACVGTNLVVSKHLSTAFPLHAFLEMRFAIMTLFLSVMMLIRKQALWLNKGSSPYTKKQWGLLFLQALCGTFLFNVIMLTGMETTTATTTGIICSVLPAIIALFAFLILSEPLSIDKLKALCIAVIGLLVIALGGIHHGAIQHNTLMGDALVFIALIPEALYTIFTKLQRNRISALAVATWVGIITIVLFLPFAIPQMHQIQWQQITVKDFLCLPLSALLSCGFFIYWTKGLATVPANLSALFVGMMPISAILAGNLFLGESLSLYDGLGLLFVLSSIALGVKTSLKRKVALQ